MTAFIIFVAQKSAFDNLEINNPALAFLVRNVDTAPDGKYFTWQKRVFSFSPAFCSASFSPSIKFAFDI